MPREGEIKGWFRSSLPTGDSYELCGMEGYNEAQKMALIDLDSCLCLISSCSIHYMAALNTSPLTL